MSRCLITKLKEVVSDDSLLKIGEMLLYIDIKNDGLAFSLKTNGSCLISVVGDGYVNVNLESINKKQIEVTNAAYVYITKDVKALKISNKYAITKIENIANGITMNIEDLKYSKITSIISISEKVYGDFSTLKNIDNVTNLHFEHSINISGNLAALKNNNVLIDLHTGNSNNVSGNLSDIKSQALKTLEGAGNYTGDIATLPNNFWYFNNGDAFSSFTWSNRDTSAKIITTNCHNATIDKVDEMLINQAQCVKAISDSNKTWEKTMAFKGNRTVASDSAIAKLQEYGYTISITPLS